MKWEKASIESRKEELEFIQRKGLILWIPDNSNKKEIEEELEQEIIYVKANKQIANRKEILEILKEAKLHFSSYPNRLMCFNEYSFSWKNPIEKTKEFKFWFNGF